MTLYELLHSISPQALLASIKEVNTHNDVVSRLEEYYLTSVLEAEPEKCSEDKHIHVLRDEKYRPIVTFESSLDEELSLSRVLSRQVLVSVSLKHLPPEKIAAYCYCSLPVRLVVEIDGKCKVSRVFDSMTNTITTKVQDYILPY